MKLRTPRDWYRRDRVGRRPGLLFLFGLLAAGVWTRVTARRIARARSVDPGIPVICVGNLTVGGAGKTPIVRELTKALIARGVAAHVLTRGHG
ncbi:MAG TPA: tetraacyldisaccharide 4'-kinase, partial [Caulobacteraceae bacterium]|nr:tetraacyldisaccharide 4'-kinase [Caulobacteraceae bacterium]